jgi:hypothetical protein
MQRKCTKCNCEFPATQEFFNGSKTLLTGTCKGCHNKRMSKFNRLLKLEVMTHYSNGVPKCACCGESFIEFLTLDHINGGGNEERRANKSARNTAYWLKKNGFPSGFRVLCMNCNFALGKFGYCPHKK